jgi:hypothetical protein
MVTQEMKHGFRLASRSGVFLCRYIPAAEWDLFFKNG